MYFKPPWLYMSTVTNLNSKWLRLMAAIEIVYMLHIYVRLKNSTAMPRDSISANFSIYVAIPIATSGYTKVQTTTLSSTGIAILHD